MRSLTQRVIRFALIAMLAVLAAAPAGAQVGGPPTPPVTLWQFLGIPQGIRKLQGATRNRRGNHPNLEPKPPLKALADPANLESDNPSIKRAAEIKQQEDLKKQKIKAVKYLASIGCGCYDVDGSVTEALVQSMVDCTEDVRYETIKAISEAAENGCCANCGSTCCCNKDILTAMARTAYERDDHGCYIEPSARVREAAAEALRICCPNDSPPVIVEAEAPPVTERETAEEVEEGEPRETGPADQGAPLPPPIPAPQLPDGSASYESPRLEGGASAPADSTSSATGAASGFGYGVVVDVSPQHGIAHVHFDQSDLVASVGSQIGVYQRVEAEMRLIAVLQVSEAFPGSANVIGEPEALIRIVRGDMILRPRATAMATNQVVAEASTAAVATVSDADQSAAPVAAQAPVASVPAVASQPAPAVEAEPQVAAHAANRPALQTSQAPVVQASELRPVSKRQPSATLRVGRRPVSAVFMP